MCGIFGAVNLNSKFTYEHFHKFKMLTDKVSYRGPDACGYYSFNSSEEVIDPQKFDIFLGHRRLSIIDLSEKAHQPMTLGECTIIFNGEIFNYIELRESLRRENIDFITDSDTEVIIRIYRHYGEGGFDRLNGMWAFILYDHQSKKIVVSRDRFSEKPLFYYENNSIIYFASEIKQLLPLLPSLQFNISKIDLFLRQGLIDYDNGTMIEGIQRVKPRSNIIINLQSKEIKEQFYWEYDQKYAYNSDIYETFTELISDSVRIRLRSDVQLGALVSGGLDSSTIAVLSQKYAKSLNTFSVISDDRSKSEEKFVDILVAEKSLKNKKLLFRTDSILQNLDKVIYHQDEPFSNFIVLAHYSILDLIKKETDITVVLSGQGGDETLFGYLRHFFFYLKYLINSERYFQFLSEILHSLLNRTVIFQMRLNNMKRYLPSLLEKDKPFLHNNGHLEKTWGFKSMRDAQIADIEKFSVPYLTRYEDRNSMAHSLEIRLPFLDFRLVNFLVNLAPEHKISRGWNKYILRNSIKELPESIRWRRDKKGFSLPEDIWLKRQFSNQIHQLFKKSVLEENGIITGKRFLEYYASYQNGNSKIHSTDITRVFITEKWVRNLIYP